MTVDNITTIIIAAVFLTTLLIPVVQLLRSYFYNPKKLTIRSKSGEIVEINLRGKGDIKAMIRFLEVLSEYK